MDISVLTALRQTQMEIKCKKGCDVPWFNCDIATTLYPNGEFTEHISELGVDNIKPFISCPECGGEVDIDAQMDIIEIFYLVLTYVFIGFGFACGFALFRYIAKVWKNKPHRQGIDKYRRRN